MIIIYDVPDKFMAKFEGKTQEEINFLVTEALVKSDSELLVRLALDIKVMCEDLLKMPKEFVTIQASETITYAEIKMEQDTPAPIPLSGGGDDNDFLSMIIK